MKFREFILNEVDPMGGGAGPLGAGPAPGGAPAMMPPGGGMDPMGGMDPTGGMGGMGGAPPMGGGMDPTGGMGGMGGGAMGGAAAQIPVKMKDADVWSVLEKLLGDQPQGGNQIGNVVQQPNSGHLMR